jgi:hypothetical protein
VLDSFEFVDTKQDGGSGAPKTFESSSSPASSIKPSPSSESPSNDTSSSSADLDDDVPF